MESIGAAKFKEHCLSLLDSVGPDGLIITKHGKPVAKLIPYPEKPAYRRTEEKLSVDKRAFRGMG